MGDWYQRSQRGHSVALLGMVAGIVMALLGGCGGLPDNHARSFSEAIPDGESTSLGKAFRQDIEQHPNQSGVFLLGNGRDAFVARALLAEQAERSIDVQYYMFHQDTVGNLLIKFLLDAADRGVRVRLLIDDMYGEQGQDVWLALDSHPSMEVRLFNPFIRGRSKNLQFVTRLKDVNYRMHSKTYTVDNQATIVGGRNIGSEYFDADPDLAFTDLDALAVGPVVPVVSSEYDEYWNSEYAYPVTTLVGSPAAPDALEELRSKKTEFLQQQSTSAYIKALDDSDLANGLRAKTVQFFWAPSKIIHDSSEKKAHDADWQGELLISQLAPYIKAVTKEFILVSPYFVPGDAAAAEFCKLAENGARVAILTNSLASNDVAAVHAGYSKYRKQLLRCGVELYELNEQIRREEQRMFRWLPGLSKSSLHAKTMGMDREIMFVGSFNFDQRSLHINNEIGILFEEPEIARNSAEKFDANIGKVAFRLELVTDNNGRESIRWHGIQNGQQVVLDSEPYVGFWTKASVEILKLLPIDSYL